MSFFGLVSVNPMVAMSMLDATKWRVVPYADTPRTLKHYQQTVRNALPADAPPSRKRGADNRKMVCFVFGAFYLNKVLPDRDKFAAIFVTDDVQNLNNLKDAMPQLQIVDMDRGEDGLAYRRVLTPQDFQTLLDGATQALPSTTPFLAKITNALGKRKPTVLETTSRIPRPEMTAESGVQRLLAEVKGRAGDDVPPDVVNDVFVKYIFRMIDRHKVTAAVTKKLQESAKEYWKQALDFADSEVGLSMAKGFRALCLSTDPDYRHSRAAKEYGMGAYSGDFVYLTSLMPPARGYSFVDGALPAVDERPQPLVKVFKPSMSAGAAKQAKRKKATKKK